MRYSRSSALATTPAYKLADYTFTGQYSYMDDLSTPATEGFGLMFYNARFYDPALGRFTSADTMIPGGVQGLDRYAYVNNSPVNYVDPSGHTASCDANENCNVQHPKKQKLSNKTGFSPEQIRKLLGLEDLSEYLDWYYSSETNQDLYQMLTNANYGDVISMAWGTESYNTDIYNFMIVKNGDNPAFYNIEDQRLLTGSELNDFTSGSDGNLYDAALMREDGNGSYSIVGSSLTQKAPFAFAPYALPNNWWRASNDDAIISMQVQSSSAQLPDGVGLVMALVGMASGGVGGAIMLVGGTVQFVSSLDTVPVYSPRHR